MTRRNMGVTVAGILLWATIIGAAACGQYDNKRGRGDAPVGSADDTPAQVVNFPDLFANVAVKCHKGNGIYVTTRDAAPVVVPNDPACAS